MSAADHGKTVEWMEGVPKPVGIHVLLIVYESLVVFVNIRKDLIGLVEKQLIELPCIWPSVEVDANIAKDAVKPIERMLELS